METCANCGQAIGKLETPHVWQTNVVCAGCYARLSANASGPEKYVDYLKVPRLVLLIAAAAATALPLIVGVPWMLCYILWGAWAVFGVISLALRVAWEDKQPD